MRTTTSRTTAIGKGQTGSAQTGSLQISKNLLGTPVKLLFSSRTTAI